ncbi:6,7,8-trihydroxycoumarin synthase-like [Ziziphus jujuba]|uniref:6,7,8-trihydroxycoumarin synthase-like n=1 Tax=Ziziphus jujuba TaxID=326968 RepID=A0ABM4A2H9_ZIZJJ|nr:6,7,8-trihydroxycoumarin synthase-like [Ziziphus jujuba]
MVLELRSAKRFQANWHAVTNEKVGNMIQTIAADYHNHSSSSSGLVINHVAFGKKYDGGKWSRFYEMIKETKELLVEFCITDFFPLLGWIKKFNGLEAKIGKWTVSMTK